MPRQPDDVAVFMNVRLASRRCPGKMLRPFAGTTLLDICLGKVADLAWPKTYFGAHEEALLERVRRHPALILYRRSAESALSDSDPHRIFEILKVIDTPYVMWINPCAPLLTVETMRAGMEFFLKSDCRSLTAVRELGGWFYAGDGRPLNETGGNVDTMLSRPILQVTHGFHIYDRARMLETGRPWSNRPGDPHLFVIPEAQAYDIDTEEEFETVEYLYRRRTHG